MLHLRDQRIDAAILVVVALVAGILWYRAGTQSVKNSAHAANSQAQVAITTTTTSRAKVQAGTQPPGSIVVHVAGAVASPGVWSIASSARVADAITAAGGPLPDADLDRLNLAAPLADGMRVTVARRGDPPTVGAMGSGPNAAGGSVGTSAGSEASASQAGPLNLNTASATTLEELPGIGPSLAAAIIKYRDTHGGFTSTRQLLDVPGIGEGRFSELKDAVAV